MKKASAIIKIISNKYFIAFAVFTVMMLFFDDNNVFVQSDRKKQLKELQTRASFYQNEIANTKLELKTLQSSPAAIEKFARESFMMKRENEDVFIIENPEKN